MRNSQNGVNLRENSGQEKALSLLYGNFFGRCVLKILTMPFISKAAGAFMDSPLSVPFIKPFIRKNNISMAEYEKADYKSFNEFFTRRIKPENRPVSQNPAELISPCDSKLTVYEINENSLFSIKNSLYSVEDLLKNKPLAEKYKGGYCMIFRLCVDDYHRYCYVDNGIKGGNKFIEGELHTVNPIALKHYNIYKRNSREYTILRTENFGDVVQVEVGAMLVGKISNRHGRHKFRRGEEKGMFQFGGSTIVLLLEKGRIALDGDILENSAKGIETPVRFGETIGFIAFSR